MIAQVSDHVRSHPVCLNVKSEGGDTNYSLRTLCYRMPTKLQLGKELTKISLVRDTIYARETVHCTA